MAKAKQVIITDEQALESIEELEDSTEKLENYEEEVEKLFDYTSVNEIKIPEVTGTLADVIPLRDFRTNYGGVQYVFSKGKKQAVPVEVKDFLLRNKQNPRIKDIY